MPSVIIWVVVGSALAALAVCLLGVRGRRVGDHPVCRRCDFDLRGLAGKARCPECAADLTTPRATAHGERRRSRVAIWAGGALAAACVGLVAVALLGGSSVHPYKPLGVLLFESRFASAPYAGEIGTEFLRRDTAAPFTGSERDRLIERLLEIQGDPARAWSPKYGDLLEKIGMTPADQERYTRQMLVMGASARERVSVGDPLPVLIKSTSLRAGSATNRNPVLGVRRATVNGRPARLVNGDGFTAPTEPHTVGGFSVHTRWSDPNGYGGVVLVDIPEGVSPGPLTLSIESVIRPNQRNLAPGAAPPDDGPWWTVHTEIASELTSERTVAVRTDPAEGLTPPRQPPKLVEFAGHMNAIPPYLLISRIDTAEPLAHRLVIVFPGGRELPVGWYTNSHAPSALVPIEPGLDRPPHAREWAQKVYGFPNARIDASSAPLDRFVEAEPGMRLVLRPDLRLAARTYDIAEIPPGEIDLGPITIDRRP